MVEDSGQPDPVNWNAAQHSVPDLPAETLQYLLGSRYCEVDRLSDIAWNLFGQTPPGWGRVQAICDWIHANIRYGYEYARPTKTAYETYMERAGVCRDFTHIAITFCRCLNIPARYATGYLGDIAVAPLLTPMDFHAWFEVFLDGQWYTFDARHNVPRIGRVLMARGRDAVDVALTTSFGSNNLVNFKVWASEVSQKELSAAASQLAPN
jgi:transglutaminase-like putative cysteine protease